MANAAPRSRQYVGRKHPREAGSGHVLVIDQEKKGIAASHRLDPRHDLRNHSPDGFQWGYGGSGPAQLALALCADATGDDELAQRVYQQFKFLKIVKWGDSFEISAGEIQDDCAGLAAKVRTYG